MCALLVGVTPLTATADFGRSVGAAPVAAASGATGLNYNPALETCVLTKTQLSCPAKVDLTNSFLPDTTEFLNLDSSWTPTLLELLRVMPRLMVSVFLFILCCVFQCFVMLRRISIL